MLPRQWEKSERPQLAKLMSHFDELPRRDRNHEIEDKAIAAFQMRINESNAFFLQITDRKDYGTDCQIEVKADGRATNARVHVQLKGTERALTVMAIRAGVLGRMATLACSHFEHVISLGFSTLGFDLCINAFLRRHNDK